MFGVVSLEQDTILTAIQSSTLSVSWKSTHIIDIKSQKLLFYKYLYALEGKTLKRWNISQLKDPNLIISLKDEIQDFNVSKELILIASGYYIYGYDHQGNQIFWTIAGDLVLELVAFDKYFIASTNDGDLRFYNRDLCIGELYLTRVVKHFVYLGSWRFALTTDHFLAVFKKNRLLWKIKLGSGVTCLKYFQGRIYIGFDTGDISIYGENSGENLQNQTFEGSILDIHVKETVYILLDSGVVKEMNISSDSKSIMSISDKKDIVKEKYIEAKSTDNTQDTQEKSMGIGNAQKLIPKESSSRVVSISARVFLRNDYQVCLKLKSGSDQSITKILIESDVLKSPCFIVDQGKSEFEIPLDLHFNNSGTLNLTIAHKSNVKGQVSSQIYRSTIDIPRFNQCILVESSLDLPPLVATCTTNDFDVFTWIKTRFISNNCLNDNSLHGWTLKNGSVFAIEILSKRVRFFGQIDFVKLLIQQIKLDDDSIHVEYSLDQEKQGISQLVDLNIQAKNAQLSNQWERFLTINSQIFKICNDLS